MYKASVMKSLETQIVKNEVEIELILKEREIRKKIMRESCLYGLQIWR